MSLSYNDLKPCFATGLLYVHSTSIAVDLTLLPPFDVLTSARLFPLARRKASFSTDEDYFYSEMRRWRSAHHGYYSNANPGDGLHWSSSISLSLGVTDDEDDSVGLVDLSQGALSAGLGDTLRLSGAIKASLGVMDNLILRLPVGSVVGAESESFERVFRGVRNTVSGDFISFTSSRYPYWLLSVDYLNSMPLIK